MKITILSHGVFFRPMETKQGKDGWICQIIFKMHHGAFMPPQTLTISKRYYTRISAEYFYKEQMHLLHERYEVEYAEKGMNEAPAFVEPIEVHPIKKNKHLAFVKKN